MKTIRLMGIMGIMGVMVTGVVTARSATNLYAFPVRVIGGQAVSLAPLIEWWKLADAARDKKAEAALGPRPMTAWVEIKAESWSPENYGWIVGADISTKARDKEKQHTVIFVKRAPLEYKARFHWLVERNKELTATQERGASAFGSSSGATQSKSEGITAAHERVAVLRELKQYPTPREFRLDLFAMATGETYRGMPVYDLGLR